MSRKRIKYLLRSGGCELRVRRSILLEMKRFFHGQVLRVVVLPLVLIVDNFRVITVQCILV